MVHAFFLLKSALIAVTVSSAIAASDLVKFVVSPCLMSIVGVKQEVGVLIHKLGQLNLVKELRGRVYNLYSTYYTDTGEKIHPSDAKPPIVPTTSDPSNGGRCGGASTNMTNKELVYCIPMCTDYRFTPSSPV